MISLKQNIYKPLLYNCPLSWGSELAEVGGQLLVISDALKFFTGI